MNAMNEMMQPTDAVELLSHDHREVERLVIALQALKGSNDATPSMSNSDFVQLDQNLTLHALAEENIFYPEMKNHPETASLVPEAYTEHQEVKQVLAEMRTLPVNDNRFQTLLAELKADLQHHVAEEENEMFVGAREALGKQRLEELGRQIQQFKTREMDNISGTMKARAMGASGM